MRRSFACVLLWFAVVLVALAPAVARADIVDFVFYMAEAQSQPSLAGPTAGELPIETGSTQVIWAGVDVRDFYTRAVFSNPYAASRHLFDVGFSFRSSSGDDGFRLVVDSAGAWFFKQGLEPATATGIITNLKTGGRGTNEIELVAVGSEGYFVVNGDYVADLDLSAVDVSGDVAVGTGYYTEDQFDGESTPFTGFQVWSLDDAGAEDPAAILAQQISLAQESDSVTGPFAGEIPLEMGIVNSAHADVDVRDFYAHAVFTNPYGAAEHLFDFGFGFRFTGTDEDLRIAVDSDGAWFYSRGPTPILANGLGAQVNTDPGASNELDLVAVGDTGYVSVNGAFVTTLDLSERDASGDIFLSSGFYQEDKIDGAITPYVDFEIWSLDIEPEDDGDAVIVDLVSEGSTDLYGVAYVSEAGPQTSVEIGAFDTPGDVLLGIHTGPCDFLGGFPAFELNPFDAESSTSSTSIDVPFAGLTSDGYAIAIRANDAAETILACGDIPTIAP